MKLLISIVPRSLTDEVNRIIGKQTLDFQMVVPAEGTASREILDYFNLGKSERDLILSVVQGEDIPKIFKAFETEIDFITRGQGVAFTVELDAISKEGLSGLKKEISGGKSHGKK